MMKALSKVTRESVRIPLMERFSYVISEADIVALERMRDMLEREIRLAETAIAEGQEVDTRKRKLKKVI